MINQGLICTSSGMHDCKDGHSWGPGVRDVYVLHFIAKGSCIFEVNGKTYHLTAGQLFLIYPFTQVKYYPDMSDACVYYWYDFSGEFALQMIEATAFSVGEPISPIFPIDELLPLFVENEISHQTVSLSPNLMRLFAYILEKMPKILQNERATSANKAAEYIKNMLHKPSLSITDVSKQCSVSRSQLYRLFIREYGISPMKYIINQRMSRASYLLETTDYSIVSIAYSVGFSDSLYFSNAFKKHFGISPLNYRKMRGIIE